MNWHFLSRLALVAALASTVYMLFPALDCAFGKADEAGFDDLQEGAAHDYMYGRDINREEVSTSGGPDLNLGVCFQQHPPHEEPWRAYTAGGLWAGFFLFGWLGRREWRKRMTGQRRAVPPRR
jgi:hypothetical protein